MKSDDECFTLMRLIDEVRMNPAIFNSSTFDQSTWLIQFELEMLNIFFDFVSNCLYACEKVSNIFKDGKCKWYAVRHECVTTVNHSSNAVYIHFDLFVYICS